MGPEDVVKRVQGRAWPNRGPRETTGAFPVWEQAIRKGIWRGGCPSISFFRDLCPHQLLCLAHRAHFSLPGGLTLGRLLAYTLQPIYNWTAWPCEVCQIMPPLHRWDQRSKAVRFFAPSHTARKAIVSDSKVCLSNKHFISLSLSFLICRNSAADVPPL